MKLYNCLFLLLLSQSLLSFQGNSNRPNEYNLLSNLKLAETLHKEGAGLQLNGDFKSAFAKYDEAQKLRFQLLENIKSFKGADQKILLEGIIKSDFNKGVVYTDLLDFAKAETLILNCIKKYAIFEEVYGFRHPERIGRVHYQLGKIYTESKGFEDAYTQFQLAMGFFNQVSPKPLNHIGNLENAISNLYLFWKEPDSLYRHSIKQYNLHLEQDEFSGTACINIGISLEMKNDLDLAKTYFDEALKFYLKDSMEYLERIELIYHNKSFIKTKEKEWELAHQMEEKAIQINRNRGNSIANLELRTKYYNNNGYIAFLEGDYESCLNYYDSSIAINIQNNRYFSLRKDIENDSALILLHKIGLLYSLGYKAKAYYALKKNKDAQDAFNLAISFLNKIRREYNDPESKIKLTEIAKVIFEGAIALHLDPKVNNSAQAFAYAEQSKAFTLLEGVKHSKAMHIAEVPAGLLDKEYELRVQITQLERQYLNAKTPVEKTTALESLRQQKVELNEVMETLEKNESYRKLMSFEPPSISQIKRKALGGGQTLVEYFVGEEKTYVFVLPKRGKLEVLEVAISSDSLNQMADAFWSSIYYYGCDGEVLSKEAPNLAAMNLAQRSTHLKELYLQYSQSLYHLLFEAVLKKHRGDHFVIVPDEGLSNMPFDALLMSPPGIDNYTYYDFLGKTVVLSYAHSANLLLEMQGQSTNGVNSRILAIAPSFHSYLASTNKSTLNRLTNNKTEVDAICDIFSGECDPVSGEDATREAFLDLLAKPYWIIHLSTHGKANDKNPNQSWISFTQNSRQINESQLLYASDLYGLSIDAELVVLSACETNKGRLRRGEGIMSFARGLSAAGVKSVLSTFWVIGEDPSLLVMKDFYQHLSAGDARDVALQKARSALMDNSDFSHPFFWSAFVPIGKMVEIEAEASFPFALILLGIGLLGVLLVSKRRKGAL
ncbi:MAG: CHAT domain-containing protein [Saprospiraceae bacterium]